MFVSLSLDELNCLVKWIEYIYICDEINKIPQKNSQTKNQAKKPLKTEICTKKDSENEIQQNMIKSIPFSKMFLKHIDGLGQGCSISMANALEILQSYTKPSILCS